jgi:urate oxidase
MQKAAAKISSSLLLLADAKSSIENMEYIAGVCATFAKSPSMDGCLLCCNGIVNSFPAIKGISYFWCNKHCANFLQI